MKELTDTIMRLNVNYSVGKAIELLLNSNVKTIRTSRVSDYVKAVDLIEGEIQRLGIKPKKKVETKSKPVKKEARVKKVVLFMKTLTPSESLATLVGKKPISRTQAVTKIWDYIKKHNLQNPKNKRNIICDETLLKITKKKEITMFELAGFIGQNLKEIK